MDTLCYDMPRCEGRPEGPCPDARIDNSVRGTQGDLMLCLACEEYCFPTVRNDTRSTNKSAKQSVTVKATAVGNKDGLTKSAVKSDAGTLNDGITDVASISYTISEGAKLIVSELLSYACFYRNSCSSASCNEFE